MSDTSTADHAHSLQPKVFGALLPEDIQWMPFAAYPPGSVIVLPGNTSHFHWAKSGDYVTQVSGNGPLGIDYVDASDDPRKR